MKATTIGIDLAKHLFQLHGVDQHGKTVLKRLLKREQMLSFFSNHPPRRHAAVPITGPINCKDWGIPSN